DLTGIDLLKAIKKQTPTLPVICISGVESFDAAVEMIRNGAFDFLAKPIKPDRLIDTVNRAYAIYREAQEKERLIGRSQAWTRELLTLRHLGESSGRDILKTLFRNTVEAVSDTLQVETVSLMLKDAENLAVTDAIGLPAEVIGRVQVKVGSGISGWVAEKGEPLLINNIEQHELFAPSSFSDQYSTQSAMCVPLKRGDRVLGVLNANNKLNGTPFSETDLDLLVTIGSQVALAIDNTRLFYGLEEKAEALEKAHEELVRLDKDKTELILNISHELKTPLTSIIGFAGLIHTLDLQGDMKDLSDYLGRLEDSADRLNHIVERMLELFRLEAGRVPWNEDHHRPTDIIANAEENLGGQLRTREIVRSYEETWDCSVIGDLPMLTRTLELVIENAVKFSPEGSSITVEGSWLSELPRIPDYALNQSLDTVSGSNGWFEFIVTDQGEGMEEREIPYIFEKFRQLGDIMTTKPPGVGLGLSISRAIIERHRGAIWVSSTPGQGSSVHLLLPGKKG
ncbi:MAG: ATP-binding protein, partial [bacterium]